MRITARWPQILPAQVQPGKSGPADTYPTRGGDEIGLVPAAYAEVIRLAAPSAGGGSLGQARNRVGRPLRPISQR
jgi:hypothetical protein